MATGFLAAGECHATSQQAMSAVIGQNPIFITSGTTTYLNQFYYDAAYGGYRHSSYTLAANGMWTQKTMVGVPSQSFPVCDMTPDYGLLGVDSATIAVVWGWGFSSVLGMYLLGYVVGVAKSVVHKA